MEYSRNTNTRDMVVRFILAPVIELPCGTRGSYVEPWSLDTRKSRARGLDFSQLTPSYSTRGVLFMPYADSAPIIPTRVGAVEEPTSWLQCYSWSKRSLSLVSAQHRQNAWLYPACIGKQRTLRSSQGHVPGLGCKLLLDPSGDDPSSNPLLVVNKTSSSSLTSISFPCAYHVLIVFTIYPIDTMKPNFCPPTTPTSQENPSLSPPAHHLRFQTSPIHPMPFGHMSWHSPYPP